MVMVQALVCLLEAVWAASVPLTQRGLADLARECHWTEGKASRSWRLMPHEASIVPSSEQVQTMNASLQTRAGPATLGAGALVVKSAQPCIMVAASAHLASKLVLLAALA